MRIKSLVGVLAVVVLMSCCMVEVEGFKKLGLLKLVKAGLILKALSPKKLLLPIPIPIPIAINKGHDSHSFGGHHGFQHGGGHFGGGHHGGYQPHYGYSEHHFGGGPHGGFGYSSSGYHIQAGHHIF